MKSTFRILFYAKWEASDEAKMLPIYARIVDQTVSREMDKLSAALSGTSFSLNRGNSEGGETEGSTEETAN